VQDLESYRQRWQDEGRRRADFHLHWPDRAYRADMTVLVAGCGTSQAAKHALRQPASRVVGIDFSGTSVRHTETLKLKYGLGNLDVHQLPVERVGELGLRFDKIVCTGVLHHLPDPEAGFRALVSRLRPSGLIAAWVYGREGNGWIVHVVTPLREHLTSHLPHPVLDSLAGALTVPLFAATRLLYGPTRGTPLARALPYAPYLSYIAPFPFREQRSIVFDHLVAPVAHYLRREEVAGWFERAGLTDVRIEAHNANSWRGFGSLPSQANREVA
jgi:SAM-dependent methyltransferase